MQDTQAKQIYMAKKFASKLSRTQFKERLAKDRRKLRLSMRHQSKNRRSVVQAVLVYWLSDLQQNEIRKHISSSAFYLQCPNESSESK